ncbi:MAG: hypothetical protein ACFFC7_18495 [Candidatus Hermodarchaeota archaeon]
MLEKVYRIEVDGEVSSLQVNSYDDLSPQFAYVLVTDRRTRKIYIWKGTGSTVRMKFMAARYALNLRMEVGMIYKTVNIDQGYEDTEFFTHIGGEVIAMKRSYGLDPVGEEQPPQGIESHFQATKTPLATTLSTEVSRETFQPITSSSPLPLVSRDSVATPFKQKNSPIRKWETERKTGVLSMDDISVEGVSIAPSSPIVSSETTASTSEAIPTFQQIEKDPITRTKKQTPSTASASEVIPTFQQIEQEAAKDLKTERTYTVLPESEFHTLAAFFDIEWPNFSFEKIGRNSEPEEWHQRTSIVLREEETLACANCRITGGTMMVENLIIKQDLAKRETIREDILKEVEKFAMRKNCHKLVIMLPSQSILVAFFEKRGWTTEARFSNDYFGQSWDRLVKFLL